MDEQERQRLLAVLAATPARLKQALAGVPRALLLWTPAPGKWSILEIVAHMRDMERDAYLARYRLILAETDPSLPDVDGDRRALEGGYRDLRIALVLREWNRLRRECLRLLKKVRGAQWERVGVHETAGRLRMEDFLRRQALGNDEAHLGQIEAIKRRFAILERLARGPEDLRTLTRGLGDEAIHRAPAPGKWSILEIACHLRDMETLYAERFTKIAHQDQPVLWVTENHRLATARRYREALLPAVIKEWKRLRADTLVLLRALPHAVWQRKATHPERGVVSIEDLATHLGNHDGSHLDQVRALLR